MHLWDIRVQELNIQSRLNMMSETNRLAFALSSTCRSASTLKDLYGSFYSTEEIGYLDDVQSFADQIWNGRIGYSGYDSLLAKLGVSIERVEASDSELFGQYELLASLSHAAQSVTQNTNAELILDAAFQSYYALCQWCVLGPVSSFPGGTVDAMRAYEESVPACTEEIASQVNSLAILESRYTTSSIGDFRVLC